MESGSRKKCGGKRKDDSKIKNWDLRRVVSLSHKIKQLSAQAIKDKLLTLLVTSTDTEDVAQGVGLILDTPPLSERERYTLSTSRMIVEAVPAFRMEIGQLISTYSGYRWASDESIAIRLSTKSTPDGKRRITTNGHSSSKVSSTTGVMFVPGLPSPIRSSSSSSGIMINKENGLDFGSESEIRLEPPHQVGEEWTISLWILCPPPIQRWNNFTMAVENSCHFVLKDGLLGTYEPSACLSGAKAFDARTKVGWQHLVAVGSDGTTAFYVNGENVGSVPVQNRSSIRYIGNRGLVMGGAEHCGSIDRFIIWDRALSSADVLDLYLIQRPPISSSTPKSEEKSVNPRPSSR